MFFGVVQWTENNIKYQKKSFSEPKMCQWKAEILKYSVEKYWKALFTLCRGLCNWRKQEEVLFEYQKKKAENKRIAVFCMARTLIKLN